MTYSQKPHSHKLGGTVIHGTLRTADLLDAFADELERLITMASLPADPHPGNMTLVHEARAVAPETDEADEIVQDLIDALNEYAPDGHYFGSHPGDGADFGFWAVEED